MKYLYCPWRQSYSDDKSASRQTSASEQECVFCAHFKSNDDKKFLILKRYQHNVVMLNAFPYNAGHLLIIPYAHVSDLDQLDTQARHEMIDLTNMCITLVRSTLNAQGVNLGMNLGSIAGAGIPSHIHMHVIPRYARDTNFLVTVSETKIISYDLIKTYEKLLQALPK